MPAKTPIGRFQHVPADEVRIGPDGLRYHTYGRRRMPFAAQVFFGYALLGPLLAAGVAALLKMMGNGRFLPDVLGATKLPPCPSPQNVLFGAGWVEAVLGCGLTGWLLWGRLWKTRLAVEETEAGPRAIMPPLIRRGIVWGAALAPLPGILAIFSLYLRTAPPDQPWNVRPFFGLLAILPTGFSACWTGIIPVVMLGLGMLVGAASGALVALLIPRIPEESITR